MSGRPAPPPTFRSKERRAFALYGVEIVLLGAALGAIAPAGGGRLAAAIFAVALLPVPMLVIWTCRRVRAAR
jgi:hypothetical protein